MTHAGTAPATELVAILPVRNEEWVLDTTLRVLSAVCDRILVGDQLSTDRTAEICRRFPKVEYFLHTTVEIPERRRNLLLDAARTTTARRVFLVLDADEILTANALQPEFRAACAALEIGEALELPWIILWRDARRYRRDRTIWSDRWLPCIFRDDGSIRYEGRWHENRVPRLPTFQVKRHGDVPLLHYAFALWERSMAKHALYRINELLEHRGKGVSISRVALGINLGYGVGKDERGMRLAQVPDEWVAAYRERGIDLFDVVDDDLSWMALEVLTRIQEFGTAYFSDLDIWDIDWESLRQRALALGVTGIPREPIRDPRSAEQRAYHSYLKRTMSAPPWRDPAVVLKPARRLARRLGINRERARRMGLLR